MKVNWLWFSCFKQNLVFGFIFQKSREVFILAEVQWLSDWGGAEPCFGQHQFFIASETRSTVWGNFTHLPFPFPFSVLLFPISQSSELWDYGLGVGSQLIFQFLHFLFQLWEGREPLCFLSHDHTFPLHPLNWLPIAFQMLGKESARLFLSSGFSILCGRW